MSAISGVVLEIREYEDNYAVVFGLVEERPILLESWSFSTDAERATAQSLAEACLKGASEVREIYEAVIRQKLLRDRLQTMSVDDPEIPASVAGD